MTVISIRNKGSLDIAAAITLGVNVKDGDSPIGHFGTGLKYAVATLLRTGHRIRIWDGSQWWHVTSQPEIIRGAQFDVIWFDNQRTGFTTALGRNWKVWQAYRELRCNAMDEGNWSIHVDDPSPVHLGETLIEVTGEGFAQAHAERARYFCEAPVLDEVLAMGTVHEGESHTIFYRGVAILELEKPTMYTYNFTEFTQLTEDRTMANVWMLPSKIGRMIAGMKKHEMVARCILAPEAYLDESASFGGVTQPTQAFSDVMRTNRNNMRANHRARDLWRALNPVEVVHAAVELDDLEHHQLDQAIKLVWKAEPDCRIQKESIRVVASLGEGILGLHSSMEEHILISRECFKMGIATVAGTILEEWAHRERGFKDCTVEFQNYFLNLLMRAAERMP